MKETWEIHWKNYYKILQIDPLAEPEFVKAMYKKLADKYHPDHNPGKQDWANKKFKEINEAFDIIDNPAKRERYYLVYCQQVNPKPIITPPPSSTSSYSSRPETKATPSKTPNVEQLEKWCAKCQKTTIMKISFINKKPAYANCPICHTYWELKQGDYRNSNQSHQRPNNNDELTPDVKKRLEEIRNKYKKHYK
jgi:curved DNA-binding protein CbpA